MTPVEKDPSKGLNGAVVEVLRGERAAKRMTLEELAKKADMPYRTLFRYLSFERAVTMAVLEPVANALGVRPEWVMEQAAQRMEAKPRLSVVRGTTELPRAALGHDPEAEFEAHQQEP